MKCTAWVTMLRNHTWFTGGLHLFENEVTLPLHTKLTDEDVEYMISNFVEIVKNL